MPSDRKKEYFQIGLAHLVRLFIYIYIVFRFLFWAFSGFGWFDMLLSGIFFSAELFILIHALGYLRYIESVAANTLAEKTLFDNLPPLKEDPPVAIIVPSYKEPINLLKNTLLCIKNLFYTNKTLYLLDDTRYDIPWEDESSKETYKKSIEDLCKWLNINLFRHKWHDAKAGIINDFLKYKEHGSHPDFTIIRNDGGKETATEKYLIIFDADMNPVPDFVSQPIRFLEANPDYAFVQTPQYYTNFSTNRVAKATSLMQAIFYEYICEAKGLEDIMLLCGTNVVVRIKALQEVGGLDCTSVTEDFATAYTLHRRGWKSVYDPHVSAFGMGPEDLTAFFKQQFRWARGTAGLLPTVIKNFFNQSWTLTREYFYSSSYYFIGWAYFILLAAPSLYMFFDIPIYTMPPLFYFSMVLPYNIATNYLFYWSHSKRGYAFTDLFSGVTLGMLAAPVYMKASLYGLLGIKGKFEVTSKEEGKPLPFRKLWPQVSFAAICWVTIVYGFLRIVFEREPILGLLLNMIWSLYYFLIFSGILYFNHTNKEVVS